MTGRRKRIIIAVLLICIIVMGLSIPSFAEKNKPITIKIAFCPLDNFFEYDANGRECGYGVDYLNELKKYANIEWEYVPVDSWESIKYMLEAGQVDVRMPVSESTVPSATCSYTVESVLPTYHAIMTLKNRNDLYYKDYDTISNMKIGIVESLQSKTGFGDYLKSIGVLDNLVYYEDYNSSRRALDEGKLDGVISNIMDLTDDMKVLDKFCVTRNYITTLKDSPCYTLINNAMTQLALENPSFQSELYEKYFPDRATEPFTKEETEYMENTDHLTIAIYPDRRPVSYYDKETGSYKGIAIDIANELSDKIGIPFEYVPITTENPRDMLEMADLLMPVAKSGDNSSYFVTKSILKSEVLLVMRDGEGTPAKNAKIGVLTTTPGIQNTIMQQNDFEIVHYSNSREALAAVQRGQIEAFANASYVVNWLLENPRYNDLRVLRYHSLPLEYEICGKAENTVLQSVLSKGIQTVSSDITEQLIKEDTAFSLDDLTAGDKLYVYRRELIGALAALLVFIFSAAFYNHQRSKYIVEIEKKGREQEKANRAKSDFLARMSHDMRTPMNGILGLSYIMEDQIDDQEVKKELFELRESGEYLLHLINDVLDVNKVESGKIELHPTACDEEKVFDSIIAMIKPQVEEKSIDFKFEKINIEWTNMMLDEQRVRQIFVNLLNNAVKFTPQGGKIDFIMELVSEDENMIRDKFIIRDNGIGMEEDFVPKAFEPFAQENRLKEGLGGTGLGLAIVKSLVELMGGTISVKSKINEGCEFTLYLNFPLVKNMQDISLQQEAKYKPSLPENVRILLCEDHPLNAQIAIRLLEKAKASVTWKENGRLGVEEFSNSKPYEYDVILMDIRMPVMNGLEASKAIRSLSREDAKTVPIIAMTANAYDEDIKKSLDAGMNGHMAKPIVPEKMYETIAKSIEH